MNIMKVFQATFGTLRIKGFSTSNHNTSPITKHKQKTLDLFCINKNHDFVILEVVGSSS